MAADLWTVVDAVGAASAVLLGYSHGGVVAQVAAAQQPSRVAGLVLLSTFARPPDLQLDFEVAAQMTLDAQRPDAPLDLVAMRNWFHGADEADLAAVARRMSDGRGPTNRSAMRHAMAALATPPPTDEQLARIDAPVLVVHSTDDAVLPHAQADATGRPYNNSRVHRLHGVGHLPTERQWRAIACDLLTNEPFASSAASLDEA